MLGVWILLALLAGLLALLAVPLELAFSVRRDGVRREGRGSLRWLFGLVRVRLGGPGERVRAGPGRPASRRPRRGGGGARRMLALVQVEGFGSRLLRLARDLFRRIRIQELSLRVRLGLDDPADTGRLWAVVGPLAALPGLRRVAIEPEFAAETFELDGRGRIRIVPLRLLSVLLRFALSPVTLRAVYATRAAAR
ncbi:DUF2953 domain-containing protein [Thioalbus denitrificans]|uniref:DUF2953 family protein n=1 Tax=Thioalbus denitrificans TaxID=547122 RepID=A0A369CBN2_9GAMM|nr:DUF2953 domain-containing protein [Thioalbus denitrificans]RCX31299.1 hypothetical protein DFQ59_103267 [Thioalbus denitrificans]